MIKSLNTPFKRILIKLSGEVLGKNGIDYTSAASIAKQIKVCSDYKVEICLVIGGGNILRGQQAEKFGMNRATGDYMGMLATLINALALQEACEKVGMYTRVLSAISMESVAENYIRRRAIRHLEKKRVVIFAAGTGNPYFTTDTTSALRAIEMNCDIILKATKVDGVYDADPHENPNAKKYSEITFRETLEKDLKIMDATAIAMCMENQMPIIVFNIFKEDHLPKILNGEKIGTYVSSADAKKKMRKAKIMSKMS